MPSQRRVPADPMPEALRTCREEARERVGSPLPNAGKPETAPIPAGHAEYLKRVAAMPRFAESFGGSPWGFRLVEIDPLIAFQFQVETARSAAMLGQLNVVAP
jgi:hypothetical protein